MASSFLDFDEKEAEERIINLSIHVNKDGFIGFNIRGGYEYGLGIYVSRYFKFCFIGYRGMSIEEFEIKK